MAEEVKVYRTIVLPRAVALYAHLFVPRPFMKNGKPQGKPVYALTHLFDTGQEGVAEGLSEARRRRRFSYL